MKTTQDADADTYTAIAHPVRRHLLDLLVQGDQPVSQLAAQFSISRPAISQHLRILLDAGLVREQRQGREHIYRLNSQPLKELDRWLESYRRLWEERHERLDELLKDMQNEETNHD